MKSASTNEWRGEHTLDEHKQPMTTGDEPESKYGGWTPRQHWPKDAIKAKRTQNHTLGALYGMRKTNNRPQTRITHPGGVPRHFNETTIEDGAAEPSKTSSKDRHVAENQEIGEISAPNRANPRPSIFLRRNPQYHDENDNNEEGHPRQSQRKYPLHAVDEQEVMGYNGAAARGAAGNNSLYQAIPRCGGKIEPFQPKIEIFDESFDDVSGRLPGQGGLYKITPPTTKTDEWFWMSTRNTRKRGYGHFTHDREGNFGAFCSMLKGFSDLSGSRIFRTTFNAVQRD